MKSYNQRLKVRTIVERWDNTYKNDYSKWKDKFKILQELKMLDLSKCTVEDISKIIGNKSWTHFRCMSCEDYKSRGVLFTDEYVCLDCIKDSLDLFKDDALSTDNEVKK